MKAIAALQVPLDLAEVRSHAVGDTTERGGGAGIR